MASRRCARPRTIASCAGVHTYWLVSGAPVALRPVGKQRGLLFCLVMHLAIRQSDIGYERTRGQRTTLSVDVPGCLWCWSTEKAVLLQSMDRSKKLYLTKACFGIALSLLLTTPLSLGAQAEKSSVRPDWPKRTGEYIAMSSEEVPPFPRTLSGYRSEAGQDFGDNHSHQGERCGFFRARIGKDYKISQYNEWLFLRRFYDPLEIIQPRSACSVECPILT